MPISRNLLESDVSLDRRQQQADARELAIREAIESAMSSGDAGAELAAREQLEALKYASQSVSDPRVETALQGATFGLSDELSAGLNTIPGFLQAKLEGSPASFGDIYQQNVTPIREAVSQYREESPGASLGYDIGGGLLTGAAAYKGLLKAAPALSRMTSLPRLGLTGAAFGGASGAGRADGDVMDRLKGAGLGAGLGGGLGVGLGMLGNLANNYIVQPALRSMRSPQSAAQRAVVETLADEGLTPVQAAQRLQQLGPQSMIADIGPNTRAVAGSVSRMSGQAGATAEKTLQSRVEGGAQRLRSALRSILGNDKNAHAEINSIVSSRAAQAKPLYDEALSKTVPVENMRNVLLKLNDLVAQNKGTGIGNAINAFKNKLLVKDGNRIIPLTSARQLDALKRDLDDKIGAAFRGGANNRVRALTEAKNALVDEMDSVIPAYSQARQVFSDQSKVIDAIKSGMKVLTSEPDDIAASLQKMSLAEQDAYRTGAIKAIETQLKNVNVGSDASRKVIRTELLKDRLRAAFPDDESLNAFVSAAERENVFAATRNEVLRGSQTRARQIADAKFVTQQSQSVGQDLMDGNVGTAARKLFSAMSKSKELGDEELAARVGEIIFAQGDDAMRLLTQAQKIATPGRFKRVLGMVAKSLPADVSTTASNEAGAVASRL